MTTMLEKICTQAAPWFAMAAMAFSLCFLLYRYFIARPPALPEADKGGHLFVHALIWFAVSRLIVLLSVVISAAMEGDLSFVLEHWKSYWIRWDAPHYLGIAENGYVTEGDPRFHIVFYPLYPFLVACIRWIFGGNTAVAACVLSNACLLAAGWVLAEAVRLRQGSLPAKQALRLMMLCPYSVFCSTAYTEALFLLLCALAVLLARRGKFGWAILAGALAANCRMPGVLTAVPIFYEMLRKAREDARPARSICLSILKVCGVLLGLAAYIGINYAVTGDPFRFLLYQKEHWGQQLGLVWGTFRYTVVNAFSYDAASWRLYTWIPQAICMLLIFVLLAASAPRRIYPGDGAFLWLYVCIALGTTWLLSGPRYLAGCWALYPALVSVLPGKWTHRVLCTAFAVLLGYLSIIYALRGWLL